MKSDRAVVLTALVCLGCLIGSPAAAYIGPGVGAGAIAAVLGVIGSVFLAIVGVVYYPIKRMIKGRRKASARADNPTEGSS